MRALLEKNPNLARQRVLYQAYLTQKYPEHWAQWKSISTECNFIATGWKIKPS
jgi:hypothetical protein